MEGQAVFNKLTSPEAVKAALADCDRMGRDAFLDIYGFQRSREYIVAHKGAQYDSKAIAAVALGYQYGIEPLRADQCTGGKDYGHAGWALDRLGFDVAGIKHVGWWIEEVDAAIDAYFEMMTLVARDEKFSKSDFLRTLQEAHPSRSYKAYEYKFQNISAVLRDLNKPWLQGYAPHSRYQHLLRYAVEDRIGRSSRPSAPKVTKKSAARIVKVDWAKREAENRELGKAGEKYVLQWERERLTTAERPDLAEKVKLLTEEGDGHGYDIASFEPDGTSLHIEVKTTTRGSETPFFVSDNEVRASARLKATYRLYRVFNFFVKPEITIYHGAIDEAFKLVATSYRATVAAKK